MGAAPGRAGDENGARMPDLPSGGMEKEPLQQGESP